MIKINVTTNKVFVINTSLLLLLSLLLLYYVIVSNSITVKNYNIDILKSKVVSLYEINGQLVAKKLVFEDPSYLSLFAEGNNMVEASNIIYLFESSGVAQK